jgi:hypothetical protein
MSGIRETGLKGGRDSLCILVCLFQGVTVYVSLSACFNFSCSTTFLNGGWCCCQVRFSTKNEKLQENMVVPHRQKDCDVLFKMMQLAYNIGAGVDRTSRRSWRHS